MTGPPLISRSESGTDPPQGPRVRRLGIVPRVSCLRKRGSYLHSINVMGNQVPSGVFPTNLLLLAMEFLAAGNS